MKKEELIKALQRKTETENAQYGLYRAPALILHVKTLLCNASTY